MSLFASIAAIEKVPAENISFTFYVTYNTQLGCLFLSEFHNRSLLGIYCWNNCCDGNNSRKCVAL